MFKNKKTEEPENIKDVLKVFEELKIENAKIRQELKSLKEISKSCFSKFSAIRYNPFSNIGGDQSFSITLLDGKNSGFILTSLFTNEGSRIYSKPVKDGKSDYELSQEEKKSLEEALNM